MSRLRQWKEREARKATDDAGGNRKQAPNKKQQKKKKKKANLRKVAQPQAAKTEL